MGRIRARELGFDACMYMLHKTFGAPKGGGGPAVGAYGCSEELVPFLPRPLVRTTATATRSRSDAPSSIGRVREYWGNVPVVVKAYSWARAMGAEGIKDAADLTVLANNYMETRLLQIRGVTRSHPDATTPRLEMTRYSLETVANDTGITVFDVQNRMVDFGIDAFWLSHEPWLLPEPFTPEPGELWSKEDIDLWIDVLEHVIDEAYNDPEIGQDRAAQPGHPPGRRLARERARRAGRRRGARTSAKRRRRREGRGRRRRVDRRRAGRSSSRARDSR